jgi:hypothetical protein
MSFAKLFAAGFGLRGGKDQVSPYHVRQSLLPQFNAERAAGSFGRTAVPEAPRVDLFTNAREPEAPEIEAEASDRPGIAELTSLPASEPKVALKPERPSFFQQAVRKRKSTPERVVQAEMELEQVQVMRNDLTEADLEFVAVARKRSREAGSSVNGKSAATVWGWLTERVFKTESN